MSYIALVLLCIEVARKCTMIFVASITRVDRLTKSTHFLAVRMTLTLEEFGRLYIWEIFQLHGVPVSMVLDRDPKFTTHFWKSF